MIQYYTIHLVLSSIKIKPSPDLGDHAKMSVEIVLSSSEKSTSRPSPSYTHAHLRFSKHTKGERWLIAHLVNLSREMIAASRRAKDSPKHAMSHYIAGINTAPIRSERLLLLNDFIYVLKKRTGNPQTSIGV